MFLRYQFSWFKPIPLRLPETRAPVKQSLSVWYMARYLTEVIKTKCYTLCSSDHLARLSAGEWCVTDSEKEFPEQVGKKALKYPSCLEINLYFSVRVLTTTTTTIQSWIEIKKTTCIDIRLNTANIWSHISNLKFRISQTFEPRFPKSNCYRR